MSAPGGGDPVTHQITLNWLNHGATGLNRIWYKINSGSWNTYDTVANTVDEYILYLDYIGGAHQTWYFYVTNDNAPSGGTGIVSVFI